MCTRAYHVLSSWLCMRQHSAATSWPVIMLFIVILVLWTVVGLVSSSDMHMPWLMRPGSSSAYQFRRGEVSWAFAREQCLALGADLLVVNSRDELVSPQL